MASDGQVEKEGGELYVSWRERPGGGKAGLPIIDAL